MALAKRPTCKDTGNIDIIPPPLKDDTENNKRKKRPNRDDENYKHEEKLFLPQKKRVLGLPPPNNPINTNRLQHNGRQNSSEDQDDETLIRETQAALKSLSGSWAGGSLYKINDQDENPTFQNLFEEKGGGRKMSPTISTTSVPQDNQGLMSDVQYKDEYAFKDFNGKCRNDMKSLHKFRRDEFLAQQQRYKDKQLISSQYQSHDFTELVDDSSNELHHIDISGTNKDENTHQLMRRDLMRDYHKTDGYLTYPVVVGGGGRPTFSQSSAFKPLTDNRKNGIGPPSYPSEYIGYSTHDGHHGQQLCGGENSDISVSDKDKLMIKSQIKEEDSSKSADSPDSKHYTILQPAGVGSKAASVMQDIAREGVVSVAAVSSTSSPGLGSVSSTTVGDKPSYLDRLVPPFSPGSINRGKFS